jgi:ribosome-associated protein
MTTSAATQKDIQKLQRLIVDGLEDVKAQDIVVFNTEHLSPLFERVIIATGTSNRQTKSLASSVRDKVREAGLPKPRLEGEDNGEWIIVDCGPAVVHIMQQAIRQYYHLEEIWGDKPVRLKLGAPKPVAAVPAKTPAAKDKPKSTSSKSTTSRSVPAKSAPTKSAPSKTAARAKPSRAPAKAKSTAVTAKPTTPAKTSKTTGRSKTKTA